MAWAGRVVRVGILTRVFSLVAILSGALLPQVRVVTTTPDLADVVSMIGGTAVKVESLTAGHEDLHLVRIRPSLLIKLRRADMFVQLGLDAEHAWIPPLLRNARNTAIRPGARGFCNGSAGIEPLQVLKKVTRADGPDLHPQGNPHYNLDPRRWRTTAGNICIVLKRVDPENATRYDAGLKAFEERLDEATDRWAKKLAPFRGAAFVEYHSSWVYFADVYGLKIVGRLEPKPGLSPTPKHLARVIKNAKSEKAGLIVSRPQNLDIAKRVAKSCGATAVVLPIMSATEGKTKGWFAFMDHVVDTFAANLTRP